MQHRSLMGVARVDLVKRQVDVFTLGPTEQLRGFALAPGKKRAYGLRSTVGAYEFWSFDLEHRKLGSHLEFPGRPRMQLKVSTNGKLLYLCGAGNTIDLYDAANYQYLRTITLDADMTTGLYVIPGK